MIGLDRILLHDVSKGIPLPDECVDVAVTSPPYYGLRYYGEEAEAIWDGSPGCVHEWGDEIIQRQRGSTGGDTAKVWNQRIGVQGTHVNQGHFCRKCGAWRGQLGLEPSPQLFISHLVSVFDEVKRILKPTGSFYLNIGDTHWGSGQDAGKPLGGTRGSGIDQRSVGIAPTRPPTMGECDGRWLQRKQLLMIPSRVAIAMQERGWILRNFNVWHKVNHLPGPWKDRRTNSWEPIFHFVKNPKYQYDLDAIRILHKSSTIERAKHPAGDVIPSDFSVGRNPGDFIDGSALAEGGAIIVDDAVAVPGGKGWTGKIPGGGARIVREQDPRWLSPGGKNPGDILRVEDCRTDEYSKSAHGAQDYHPLGRNPGDVLEITTRGLSEDHYASFPVGLIVELLKPHNVEVCVKCRKSRTKVYEDGQRGDIGGGFEEKRRRFLGWSKCKCDAGFGPAVVFDPFMGAGTTAVAAKLLGMRYMGTEIVPKYVEIAERRLSKICSYEGESWIDEESVPTDSWIESDGDDEP